MAKNSIRKSLGRRLEVTDIEYDIKRMSAEMEYHKAKSIIFDQAIKAQQSELGEILDVPQHSIPKGEFYK
jgi:hypothetical protein